MNNKNQLKLPKGTLSISTNAEHKSAFCTYVCFVLLFLISTPAYSQSVRYVSNTGSDTGNNCLTVDMPCATVQHAIDSVAVNDTIIVEQGTYSENLTISTRRLTIQGAQVGIDARGRNSSESEITGYINITGNADSLTIDGFSISEGAAILGSKAGIYISHNATNITIQNNVFKRSGTVDGDGYRGIINAIGGAQTDLLIQNNSFTGWATGIFLNPGPAGARLLNNEFDNNFVGVSIDGPDSTFLTGNSFNNNLFEGLGIGPWTDSGNSAPDPLVATFTNNSFSSDSNYIGLYSGTGSEFDFSSTSFEGVVASTMSTTQLLSAEKKIGHGVDASGGYSGFALLKTDHVFVSDGNSISTALGFASNGWTMYVDSGSYEPFSIGLSGPSNLNIQGVSGATVSRDSAALNRVVDLRADSVTFSGFTIKGGGTHVGISISGQNLTISNNKVDSVSTGIQTTTQYTDGKNSITGNTITNSGYGISLQNNQNTVTSNTITVTTEGFGIGSSGNTITGNQITMSTGGTPLQTYSGGSLPGADVNITSALNDNTFNRAVVVKNSSGVSVESIFGGIQDAIDQSTTRDTILVETGNYEEPKITAVKDSLSVKLSSGVSGVDSLVFDNSISDLAISGNENSLVIIGNANDNKFNISGDKIEVEGGTGSDTVILSGNRSDYTISDNSGIFSFVNGSAENKSSGVELATFDDITITLNFADPVSYPGRSITFADNNSNLSIPDDNSLDATSSLSIEFWMKKSGFSSSDQSILFKGSDTWSIHRYNSTSFLAFTTYHSGNANTLFGNIPITDDKWHHIAAVFNGSRKSIYIDGKLDSSSTISGNLDVNSEAITIGGWTGSIDDLRFWTVTRDSSQLRDNSFQQLKGDETGLQGYWRMDEGSGSLVADLTTNSNDAYIPSNASISWNASSHPIGTFITGNEGWRIITSPANGVTYGELLNGVWTQGFTGADTESGSPNVFTYNEGDGNTDASSRGFQSIGSSSEVANAGEAILVYVYQDDDPETAQIQGGFPKTIKTDSAQHSGTVTASLSLTKSGGGGTFDDSNDGWNLVGNPYATSIDWDASSGWNRSGIDNTIYVWSDSANSGTGAYLSWNGMSGTLGSGKLAPMQGFWVKANDTGNLSFSVNDTARSNGAALLKPRIVPEILLQLEGVDLSNTTMLMFSEQAKAEKDVFDAYKLHSLNAEYLSVSTTLEDGIGLDINALPTAFESDLIIPLVIDGSDLSGSIKLSWSPKNIPENLNVTLVDTYEDLEIDLTTTSGYTFEVEVNNESKSKNTDLQQRSSPRLPYPSIYRAKTEHSSRFEIRISSHFSTNSETDIGLPTSLTLEQNYPNPFNPDTQIAFAIPTQTKVRLVVYDILGRMVATILDEQIMSPGYYSMPFQSNGLSSGVYLYELTTGGSRIVKKMTLLK